MKITLQKKKNGGYVLMIVLALGVIGLTFMAGSMDWANNTSAMTDRNNEYFTTAYAAEAATAQALAGVITDYRLSGEGVVQNKLDIYRVNVPNSTSNAYWGNYQFTDATSVSNVSSRMFVGRVATNNTIVLAAPYSGLTSIGSTYQVVADAKNTATRNGIKVGVGQEVNLGIIPIFQFAIFYEDDMEIHPGPNMIIGGLVHGNGDLYIDPGSGSTLTFSNDVSASGNIFKAKRGGESQSGSGGTINYLGRELTNVASLNLPVGTGFTNGAHGLLDVPPIGESATNGNGTNRLYHQADMIVLVSNTTVTVKGSLQWQNEATLSNVPWSQFISTNVTFSNTREAATVRAVTIDVGKLRAWDSTNTGSASIRTALGHNISSIYIADMRTMTSTQEAGICLTNGQYLPPLGLTVVTPDPAYTIGNYNITDDGVTTHAATSDTTHTLPASIMCDAINVLSSAWNNAQSFTNSLSGRAAQDVTVNAAFLSGIVESTNISSSLGYSGGVENFPRFLEDWSGHTFTYNGSMVEMFDSAIANNPWLPGSYNPPVRNWFFDDNFMIAGKQPPMTPAVKTVSVPRWVLLAPNVTNF